MFSPHYERYQEKRLFLFLKIALIEKEGYQYIDELCVKTDFKNNKRSQI